MLLKLLLVSAHVANVLEGTINVLKVSSIGTRD